MISANVSKATRRAVYARDYYRCALCDTPRGLQIHHVIPRSQGGSNEPENLITLCMWCHNAIHGTRWPDMPDWMDREELQQAAVEYLADYYAGSWYPWEPGQSRYERETGGISPPLSHWKCGFVEKTLGFHRELVRSTVQITGNLG